MVKVAFDADGKPTKGTLGFVHSNGVEVADLERRQTIKGGYLFVSKVVEGRPTGDLLPEMLPRLIDAIPFKKSMRWKDLDIRFARPVHWIVALVGGQVVPSCYGNLASCNLSRGHRFMAPDSFEVTDLDQYLEIAEKHFLIVDPARHRRIIAEQLAEVVARAGGKLNPDEALLDENGKLLPRFITISNTRAEDPVVVQQDNERVLLSWNWPTANR